MTPHKGLSYGALRSVVLILQDFVPGIQNLKFDFKSISCVGVVFVPRGEPGKSS